MNVSAVWAIPTALRAEPLSKGAFLPGPDSFAGYLQCVFGLEVQFFSKRHPEIQAQVKGVLAFQDGFVPQVILHFQEKMLVF
ncbi:MAG: hypothetical protein HFF35_09605 [Oscillospiraceae bacterium]|nr:hypothetical protein [Oscillospiraceae bacterium]